MSNEQQLQELMKVAEWLRGHRIICLCHGDVAAADTIESHAVKIETAVAALCGPPADTAGWLKLSSIRRGDQLIELLAATCHDGIGVIARWTWHNDRGWSVKAMDTESAEGMQPVTDFHDGECVPCAPPVNE